MFNWIINKIAGDYNQRQISKLTPIVQKINELYEQYDSFSDEEIKSKTEDFKFRLKNGESLDDILPEAFAVVKQACKRLVGQKTQVKGQEVVWNMIPYDVQLVGGIILHQGKIAEMKTGEGKTLVASLPVYLNALTGNGVHVVTVNDYLASRDAQWMGYLYERLGLTIGTVVKETPLQTRREQYSKDITYVENSELGFDYLRDNLLKSMDARSLIRRPLNFAIVDEVDSILIDEARTPLIISEPEAEATDKYVFYSQIVRSLSACKVKKKVSKGLLQELLKEDAKNQDQEDDGDYYIDEKTKTVSLSGKGIEKLEKIIGVENLYKDIGYEEIHHIENALKAQAVYEKDKEYIVKDGEVLIVDEHTGRTMPGRRFSEGLHQAIEAKEGVNIQRESKTMATITYQNFFKQYKKLAGMTGTASTEGEEFEKIYELGTLVIPTNRPTIRVDNNDKVFFNQNAKWKFVTDYIEFYHGIGQPILIGTSSIFTSEYVSKLLQQRSINHYVLNAKFHEQEAHIVGQAGKFKSVVVATNMAGRGTDIKLEEGLNEKLADNYAKWIEKTLTKNSEIKVSTYSEKEFNLTIEGLKRHFNIDDEQVRQAGKSNSELNFGNKKAVFEIKFNKSKKENSDYFSKITFKPSFDNNSGSNTEIVEKDFHYGLFILGTEKHESRRIDNQLRGRAGRQGDPGVSVFFVALDDLIMRKMGGERIQGLAGMLLKKEELENMELNQKQFTSSIVRAQKQMEARHYGIRKHLFDYDNVINKQRQRVYGIRDGILQAQGDKEKQQKFVEETKIEIEKNMKDVLLKQIENAENLKQTNVEFLEIIKKEFSLKIGSDDYEKMSKMGFNDLSEKLPNYLISYIKETFEKIDEDRLFNVFKDVYLHFIDKLWVAHIDEMQYLRDKVGLMGYAQLDPLIVYKKEAYEQFVSLLYRLKFDTVSYLLGMDFDGIIQQQEQMIVLNGAEQNDEQYIKMLQNASQEAKKIIPTNDSNFQKGKKVVYESEDGFEVFQADEFEGNQVVSQSQEGSSSGKTRPNDPCPCGSGKKYKKCHGKD